QGLDTVHPAESQANKSASTLQEQEGQQTRSYPAEGLGTAPATRQDATATFDWSRVGEPTADDFKVLSQMDVLIDGPLLHGVDQEQLQQQHKHVLALATIVNQLTELLPRIMPALTIKSRLEMLPMVQTIILATLDPETQRVLVGLVFNGVATPDPAQRSAVVGLCAGVAAALGPTWAAQEVLSMCTKQEWQLRWAQHGQPKRS
ncbi:hypothetical protein DUNSADRAFT_5374, partial [Dunaliella salina]